jgi:hypothetical protein
LNLLEHLADGVDHAQKRGSDLGIQLELAVPQPGQQVLTYVCDLFQIVERQKSAGALDRMDGAKHSRQRIPV